MTGKATNRTLYGTTGVDVTLGLGSDDIIYGWGRESFTPDEGDFLCGGEGNDSVHGFGGNDEVVGNAGHDTVTGYVGADRLIGGTGSDQVHGGAGHDWLQGGLGNDRVVDTSTGADELYGGEGDDSLDADNAQAVAHKPDFVDGGDGFDVCTVDEEDEVVNCEDVFVLRP